ncbi:MAG: hypothetical protein Roseis2KO_21130 [Roseivirga sp.]
MWVIGTHCQSFTLTGALPLAGWLWLPQAARNPTAQKGQPPKGQTPNPRSRGLVLVYNLPRESGPCIQIDFGSRLEPLLKSNGRTDQPTAKALALQKS